MRTGGRTQIGPPSFLLRSRLFMMAAPPRVVRVDFAILGKEWGSVDLSRSRSSPADSHQNRPAARVPFQNDCQVLLLNVPGLQCDDWSALKSDTLPW